MTTKDLCKALEGHTLTSRSYDVEGHPSGDDFTGVITDAWSMKSAEYGTVINITVQGKDGGEFYRWRHALELLQKKSLGLYGYTNRYYKYIVSLD